MLRCFGILGTLLCSVEVMGRYGKILGGDSSGFSGIQVVDWVPRVLWRVELMINCDWVSCSTSFLLSIENFLTHSFPWCRWIVNHLPFISSRQFISSLSSSFSLIFPLGFVSIWEVSFLLVLLLLVLLLLRGHVSCWAWQLGNWKHRFSSPPRLYNLIIWISNPFGVDWVTRRVVCGSGYPNWKSVRILFSIVIQDLTDIIALFQLLIESINISDSNRSKKLKYSMLRS